MQEIQQSMKGTSTNGKTANHRWRAMAAAQMLLEKQLDMGWTNLSRADLPFREPSSEVRHDSTIQADGALGVSPTAEIASEGLGNYVNLAARTRLTIVGTTT
jgi:hypothetical protein